MRWPHTCACIPSLLIEMTIYKFNTSWTDRKRISSWLRPGRRGSHSSSWVCLFACGLKSDHEESLLPTGLFDDWCTDDCAGRFGPITLPSPQTSFVKLSPTHLVSTPRSNSPTHTYKPLFSFSSYFLSISFSLKPSSLRMYVYSFWRAWIRFFRCTCEERPQFEMKLEWIT